MNRVDYPGLVRHNDPMGNVHSVIQIEPRYFEGAAIEVKPSEWARLQKLYIDRPHDQPNILVKEFSQHYRVFCDTSFHEIRRFLVVQDGGKRGYEIELPEQMRLFSPCLEDALFYVDDEYAGYVDRYQIRDGELEYERMVESGGDAVSHLEETLKERPDLYLRFLYGHAMSLKNLASGWQRLGNQEAARDDLRNAAEYLQRAAGLRDDDWLIQFQLGFVMNELEEFQKASEPLKNALALLEKDKVVDQRAEQQRVKVGLGYAASHLGQQKKALDLYQEAAALKSMTTGQQARINESVNLIQQGRHQEGEAACLEVLRNGSSRHDFSAGFYNLACALARQDRKTEALKALWAAVALRPEFIQEAAKDEDLAALHDQAEFEEIIRTGD